MGSPGGKTVSVCGVSAPDPELEKKYDPSYHPSPVTNGDVHLLVPPAV
ncbi:hypothetical protein [Streptomyces sioyaensis]